MPVRRSSASLHEAHIQMMLLEASDEEGSVSSTQTVDKHKLAVVEPNSQPRKQVTFDESRNTFHANQDFCKEDTKYLWFHSDDLHAFKCSKINIAKEIIRHERRQQRTSENPASCYLNVMERVYSQCCQSDGIPPTSEDELVQQLDLLSDRVLGLEGVTVRGVSLDRRARRRDLMDAVLGLQTLLPHANRLLLSPDELEARIARAAQDLSQPSRLFAARLARARQQQP